LRPQIQKQLLEDMIKVLNEMTLETFESSLYEELIYFFEKHEFYLSQEQCTVINEKLKLFENIRYKDSKLDIFSVNLPFKKLSPNPELDESYFL
jgi:hypothetical protein